MKSINHEESRNKLANIKRYSGEANIHFFIAQNPVKEKN